MCDDFILLMGCFFLATFSVSILCMCVCYLRHVLAGFKHLCLGLLFCVSQAKGVHDDATNHTCQHHFPQRSVTIGLSLSLPYLLLSSDWCFRVSPDWLGAELYKEKEIQRHKEYAISNNTFLDCDIRGF